MNQCSLHRVNHGKKGLHCETGIFVLQDVSGIEELPETASAHLLNRKSWRLTFWGDALGRTNPCELASTRLPTLCSKVKPGAAAAVIQVQGASHHFCSLLVRGNFEGENCLLACVASGALELVLQSLAVIMQ